MTNKQPERTLSWLFKKKPLSKQHACSEVPYGDHHLPWKFECEHGRLYTFMSQSIIKARHKVGNWSKLKIAAWFIIPCRDRLIWSKCSGAEKQSFEATWSETSPCISQHLSTCDQMSRSEMSHYDIWAWRPPLLPCQTIFPIWRQTFA